MISEGEHRSLSALLKNRRAFLGFLEARLGNRQLAEDVLQSAMLKSLDKLTRIRKDERAVAWFYRVLRNALIDHHRRHSTEAKALQAAAISAFENDQPELHKAVCQCVTGLATGLRADYAKILQRVDVEDEPVCKVAKEEQITINNANVRLHRARAALRRRVQEMCAACAVHGCLDCTCRAAL